MRDYRVNIIGLSKKDHLFEFKIGDDFFEQYGKEVVSGGRFEVHVVLDKRETFIEANFKISGKAVLVCDRSLELFEYPLDLSPILVFKYGDEPQEISDEIVIISRDQDRLDLGQYIYEFIALAIPIKRLHPRFEKEVDDEAEGKMIYSTSTDSNESTNEEKIDPRWEKLKKLK